MLFLDVKYANLLSPYLRNYKKKSDFLWNFSCPICGDSKKNPLKARAYLYRHKETIRMKCHNCDYSSGIRNFLKEIDTNLFNEYLVEVYAEGKDATPKLIPNKVKEPAPEPPLRPEDWVDSTLQHAKRLDTLPEDHPALLYVKDRKLPEYALKLLYYVPKFKKFVNRIVPNKFEDLTEDSPRLVIPYFDKHGGVYTFQGRAFGKEEPRYISIRVKPDASRIYGLDRVDPSKRVYACEGPIDSLCLPNTIAVSGSSFVSSTVELLKSNLTVVPDNEPHNPEICKLIKRMISKRFHVCIWPDTIEEKDINEMILSGKTAEEILAIIDANTFHGAAALMRFNQWSKSK